MKQLTCPRCGKTRTKKFGLKCEACGASFITGMEIATTKQGAGRRSRNSSNSRNQSIPEREVDFSSDIPPKAQKFISMAAYDLAIDELEFELESNRSAPVLHALAMCYLCKSGGISGQIDFSNWFTIVVGVIGAIEKAVTIDAAEDYISEAIDIEPDNNTLYKTLALCKYSGGDYEDALKMGRSLAREAVATNERAACHVFIGNCFRQLGNNRAYENRLQYAAHVSQNQIELARKIEEMVKAKNMLMGGATMAGYALGGFWGAVIAAGVASAVEDASAQRQFEDNDPEILNFIRQRDQAIRYKKQLEEEKRKEEDIHFAIGCLFIFFIIFMLFVTTIGGK